MLDYEIRMVLVARLEVATMMLWYRKMQLNHHKEAATLLERHSKLTSQINMVKNWKRFTEGELQDVRHRVTQFNVCYLEACLKMGSVKEGDSFTRRFTPLREELLRLGVHPPEGQKEATEGDGGKGGGVGGEENPKATRPRKSAS